MFQFQIHNFLKVLFFRTPTLDKLASSGNANADACQTFQPLPALPKMVSLSLRVAKEHFFSKKNPPQTSEMPHFFGHAPVRISAGPT